jgi:hypothetical protein
MPQNANSQRVIDLCNELSSVRARLNVAAENVGDSLDIKADLLTEAANAVGDAFEKLWNVAGFIARTPNDREDEWARLLAVGAKRTPRTTVPVVKAEEAK